jgi:hypothetical protein
VEECASRPVTMIVAVVVIAATALVGVPHLQAQAADPPAGEVPVDPAEAPFPEEPVTPTGGDRRGLPPDAIDPPAWPRSTTIWPAPDPFSLNGYDALQAMSLIRRAGLLVERTGEGRRTVVVESVDAVPAEPLPEYPPGHRDRWDLLLNGEAISWDTLYVEYGGRLLSLRLLFTYRNQRPVPDIPYILE